MTTEDFVRQAGKAIQAEIDRLKAIGWHVSFDCEEGWLIAEDSDGVPAIIARLPKEQD